MAYSDIKDPSAHFQLATYTGNGDSVDDTNAITNSGNSDMQPDFTWFKRRDYDNQHLLFDSTRGVTKYITSDRHDAEGTIADRLVSFDTNGFTVKSSSGAINQHDEPFICWEWKANGGTTASNTDGTITSTVQANTDAGFSIVTYTGTGVYNKTVGHGLGVAPAVVILKNRTTGEASYDDWWVYHKDTSNPVNRALRLNESGGEQSSTVFWSVVPSSTIFGVGGSVDAPRYTNGASQNYVAYCFAEKQGYSKFGKYVGNGAREGVFVYTGFQPAFVMIKCFSAANGKWTMFDNKRTIANGDMDYLVADDVTAESNAGLGYTDPIDLVSNGFKIRNSDLFTNQSAGYYIYMAFAEHPFVAGGIPTTAR